MNTISRIALGATFGFLALVGFVTFTPSLFTVGLLGFIVACLL